MAKAMMMEQTRTRTGSGHAAAYGGGYKVAQTHALGHCGQRPSHDQDRAGEGHQLKAVHDGAHGVFEGEDLGKQRHSDAGHCHAEGAPVQSQLSVAGIQNGHEICARPVGVGHAGVDDAEDNDGKGDHDGQYEGADHGLGALGLAQLMAYV